MYREEVEAPTPLTPKEIALESIARRISGLQATIDHYEADLAEVAADEAAGKKFCRKGCLYPVNYDAINREIKRMKAARKDVKTWAN